MPGDGVLRVRRETGGRGGKTVTTISGASPADARDLAKALKKLCGSGGAVKDGIVEIQGDHRDGARLPAEAGPRRAGKPAGS